MKYDQFINEVQQRARLSSSGEAVKAVRSTLEVLDQRLPRGSAENCAAQLPSEIGIFLGQNGPPETFDLDEFFQRVSEKEETGLNTAVFHARAVISVLGEAVSAGEWTKIRDSLGADFEPLWQAGSEGPLTT